MQAEEKNDSEPQVLFLNAAAEKISTVQNPTYDEDLATAARKQHGKRPLESSSSPLADVMHFFYITLFSHVDYSENVKVRANSGQDYQERDDQPEEGT